MKTQKGMTLIELMATIAIAGALAAIAIPKISGMSVRAKSVEVIIQADAFYKAMDAYTITQGHPPATLAEAGFFLPNSSFFNYAAEGEANADKNNGGKGQNKQMDHKQSICHNNHTITVANPAIYNAHLEHGDSAEECAGETLSLVITPQFTISPNCPAGTAFSALWSFEGGGALADTDGDCTSIFN